jgi:hypothetical protein
MVRTVEEESDPEGWAQHIKQFGGWNREPAVGLLGAYREGLLPLDYRRCSCRDEVDRKAPGKLLGQWFAGGLDEPREARFSRPRHRHIEAAHTPNVLIFADLRQDLLTGGADFRKMMVDVVDDPPSQQTQQ